MKFESRKKSRKIIILLMLLGFVFLSKSSNLSSNDAIKQVPLMTPRIGRTENSLLIELIEPTNTSTITNGTEILCRLIGSLDNKIYYHWSVETSNHSFTVVGEYFIINAPVLENSEFLLTLQLYSSENSSNPDSSWIKKNYIFRYDYKAPQYSISYSNESQIDSFSIIEINSSEEIVSSYYQWESNETHYLGTNTTRFNVSVDLAQGNHTLELFLQDSIGNINQSHILFQVQFAIRVTPVNESTVRSGEIINLEFSDPYNVLYAWDTDSFSGVIDPVPSGEGEHILHVNVEKSPNQFEMWNFSYTVDNTPINVQMNPTSGYITPLTNLTIIVGETPVAIWGNIEYVNPIGNDTIVMTITGNDPYWTILPSQYGEINVTIYVEDIAGNIGSANGIFNIALGVISITPENNSYVEQGSSININLNHDEWRTILYNQGNTYKPSSITDTVGPTWTSTYCNNEDGIPVWEDKSGTSSEIRNEMWVTMDATNIDSVIVYPGCYSSNDHLYSPYQIELRFYDANDSLTWSRLGEFGFPYSKYGKGYDGGEGSNERDHTDDDYYYAQPLVIELPEEIKKESISRLVIVFLSLYSPDELYLSNNFGITELEVFSTSDEPEIWSPFKIEGISRMSDYDDTQGEGKGIDNGDDIYIFGTKWNRESYPRQMGTLPISLVCSNNDKSNPNRRWNFGYSVPIIVRSDLPNEQSFDTKTDLDTVMLWTIIFIGLLLGLAIIVGVVTGGVGSWLVGLGSACVLSGSVALGLAAYAIGMGIAAIGVAAVCFLVLQIGLMIFIPAINVIGHLFNNSFLETLSVPYVERSVRKWIYDAFGSLGLGTTAGVFWD